MGMHKGEIIDVPHGGGVVQVWIEGEGPQLLIYHHGTPAAGRMEPDLISGAAAVGLRVAQVVRPGYANSTRQPGRTVADVVPAVVAVADALGAERFVTLGWSGGGPHALATAALLPDRCAGAICLAGVAMYGDPDIDFLEGMGEDNIAEFNAAVAGPTALAEFLNGAADSGLRDVTGAQLVDALRTLLPEVDQRELTGTAGEQMAESIRWSLSTGIWGWLDDDLAFTRPWGFELASIAVPVQVWQGSEDLMVPASHGPWLADRIPDCSRHLVAGQGHLSIAQQTFAEGLAALRATL
jgi:pimeloyl-ACP methyl ester carboxylesterase